jgi:DNA-binding response OmpR family regulator
MTDEKFHVLSAADGELGLAAALEHHPHLILLDIFMPRMDGITMLSKLRSADTWGKHVNVIVLTNSTDVNDDLADFRHLHHVLKTELFFQLGGEFRIVLFQ